LTRIAIHILVKKKELLIWRKNGHFPHCAQTALVATLDTYDFLLFCLLFCLYMVDTYLWVRDVDVVVLEPALTTVFTVFESAELEELMLPLVVTVDDTVPLVNFAEFWGGVITSVRAETHSSPFNLPK
jgi:hypothetical protein